MGTANVNLPVKSYQKEFCQLLGAVVSSQAYFNDLFAGGLQTLDGVKHSAIAFSVKTADMPAILNNSYSTSSAAFNSSAGKSTRFGPRTEITYVDTDVPYTWRWSFHEGLDRHTVNNGLDEAIADRLELHARAKCQQFDKQHGAFFAASAGKVMPLDDYSAEKVQELFNKLSAYFTNIGGSRAMGTRTAKVNAQLYNAIVDHPLATAAKGSSVNIDQNGLLWFKGFLVEQVPDELLRAELEGTAVDHAAYVYITGIAKAFTGINTTRVMECEDFDGVALQGTGKAGEFVLDDNKPAMVRVTI